MLGEEEPPRATSKSESGRRSLNSTEPVTSLPTVIHRPSGYASSLAGALSQCEQMKDTCLQARRTHTANRRDSSTRCPRQELGADTISMKITGA